MRGLLQALRGAAALVLGLAGARCSGDESAPPHSGEDTASPPHHSERTPARPTMNGSSENDGGLRGDAGDEALTAAPDAVTEYRAPDVPPLERIAQVALSTDAPILSVSSRGDLAVAGLALTEGPPPELVVIRVEPPSAPVVVGTLSLEASVRALFLEGTRVYAATSDDARELVIVDVSDASNPVLLGGFDAGGDGDGISLDVAGNRVVLGRAANASAELHFLDAADPSAVVEKTSVEVGFDVNDVETNDFVAYLATSDPSAELQAFMYGSGFGPVRVWSFDAASGPAVALDISERHLYAVTASAGKGELLEFQAPWQERPTFVKSLSFAQEPSDVFRYGGRAVVAFRGSGIAIVGGLDENVEAVPIVCHIDLDGHISDAGVSDATGGTSPDRVFEIEKVVREGDMRALAYHHDAILAGNGIGDLELFRSMLIPTVADQNADGHRMVPLLGDSNTKRADDLPTWADLLPGLLAATDWQFTNHAWPMASTWKVYDVVPSAFEQLDSALAQDAPDGVMLAFGENDVVALKDLADALAMPIDEALVRSYICNLLALREKARTHGVTAFFALTPPENVPPDYPQMVLTFESNHRLRNEMDPATLIDFFSTMVVPDDYSDTLHLGPTGQTKRALEASRKLEP